jgi:tetratricopeptide (TPR) repeat protein
VQTTLGRITLLALLTSSVGLLGCGSTAPAVGHRTAGLKHAVNADTAYRLGRFGVAAQRYRQALVHLRAADDVPAVARALHNYGMAIKADGRCAEAIRYLQESAALHSSLQRSQEQALNLLAVGECQHDLGQREDAVTTLGQARKWALDAKDKALAARAVAGIGAALASSGRTALAKQKYAKAAKLAKGGDDVGAVALVQNNQGRLLARNGEHAAAAALFLRAADGFRKANDGDGLASALSNAATSLQAQGGDALGTATLFQRSAFAATAVKRYRHAATSFSAAARLFDQAAKPEQARSCRESGRRVLDAFERDQAVATEANK